MYFVYFLRSESDPTKTYNGFTGNLVARLREHNEDDRRAHTKRHRPWRIEAFFLADTREIARRAEKYFKSPAGKQKFERFAEANPEHLNPIEGFFTSQEVGRLFGRRATGFKVKSNIMIVKRSET